MEGMKRSEGERENRSVQRENVHRKGNSEREGGEIAGRERKWKRGRQRVFTR